MHTHRRKPEAGVLQIMNLMPCDLPPEGQYFSAGLHPWYVQESNWESQLQWINALVGHPELVAIGECGIDMLYPDPAMQSHVFELQAALAQQHRLPLILHAVRSHDRLIAIRRNLRSSNPWIVHGFSSRPSIAKQYLDHGFYLSFGAALFNANATITESFRLCPEDRIFLETDNHAVKLNELYHRAAALRGMQTTQLASRIYRNFVNCFGLTPHGG
ncbi:MAG TPA: TatD family hydrolase [Bacteroidales bacterium]|nr:TatD family hydrolase [Bacteroidales bacterium]